MSAIKLSKIHDNFNPFEQYLLSRVLPLFPDLSYQFSTPVGKPKLQFPKPPNDTDINANGYPVYPRLDLQCHGDTLFPYFGSTGNSNTRSTSNQKIALVLYMAQEMTVQANTNFRSDKALCYSETDKLRDLDLELLKTMIGLVEEHSLALIERHPSYVAYQTSTDYNRAFLFYQIAKTTHQSGNAVNKGTRTTKLLATNFIGTDHMGVMDNILSGRAHLLQDFSDDGKTINVDRFCHYVYLNSLKEIPALEFIVHDLNKTTFDGTSSSLQNVMSTVNDFINDHPEKFNTVSISDVNPVGYVASAPSTTTKSLSRRVFPFIQIDRNNSKNNPSPLPENDRCTICKSLGWFTQAKYHRTNICAHNPTSPNFNAVSLKYAQSKASKESNKVAKALLGTANSDNVILDEFQRQVAISYGNRLAAEHFVLPTSAPSSVPTNAITSQSSVSNE